MHRWLQPASSASGRETAALLKCPALPRSRSHANVSEGAIKSALTPLSSQEEIALRRIAHGSNVDQPTAARLQDLVLIRHTISGYPLRKGAK